MTVTVTLPIRTESEANLREHWAKKNKRVQAQRQAAKMLTICHRQKVKGCNSISVTLTRIAPRKLDTDNLARSFKAVRDGIADGLNIDDGSAQFQWSYAQEKGKPKEYSVRAEIIS
jgi:uncharacterized protein (DUF3084 family)